MIPFVDVYGQVPLRGEASLLASAALRQGKWPTAEANAASRQGKIIEFVVGLFDIAFFSEIVSVAIYQTANFLYLDSYFVEIFF